MDYDKNCNFVVKKENNDLKVLNNKLNEKVDKLEIIKVGADNKIQNKTLISENNFFSKNSEGIFFIKIHYKKEGKSKNNTCLLYTSGWCANCFFSRLRFPQHDGYGRDY